MTDIAALRTPNSASNHQFLLSVWTNVDLPDHDAASPFIINQAVLSRAEKDRF
jgi:hypothetical protein